VTICPGCPMTRASKMETEVALITSVQSIISKKELLRKIPIMKLRVVNINHLEIT